MYRNQLDVAKVLKCKNDGNVDRYLSHLWDFLRHKSTNTRKIGEFDCNKIKEVLCSSRNTLMKEQRHHLGVGRKMGWG